MDYLKTIAQPAESLVKSKGSKFLAYAFPFSHEEQLKPILENLKKEHHTARHWCYAFQLTSGINRSNDDGEPSGTAGKPILNALHSSQLQNVLIVVVRYFGGTLLGVRGLIDAYYLAANEVIKNANIIDIPQTQTIVIKCTYDQLKAVQILQRQLNLISSKQVFEVDCILEFEILNSKTQEVIEAFKSIYNLNVTFAHAQ